MHMLGCDACLLRTVVQGFGDMPFLKNTLGNLEQAAALARLAAAACAQESPQEASALVSQRLDAAPLLLFGLRCAAEGVQGHERQAAA